MSLYVIYFRRSQAGDSQAILADRFAKLNVQGCFIFTDLPKTARQYAVSSSDDPDQIHLAATFTISLLAIAFTLPSYATSLAAGQVLSSNDGLSQSAALLALHFQCLASVTRRAPSNEARIPCGPFPVFFASMATTTVVSGMVNLL